MSVTPQARPQAEPERRLIDRALAGDAEATRQIITANNQRLYRAAWSILGERAATEDAVQEAYAKAFTALNGFKGESSLATWLTRIVINEALGRRRSDQRRARSADVGSVAFMEDYRAALAQGSAAEPADKLVGQRQIAAILEHAIAQLPEPFRTVLILREVEGLSADEVGDMLGLEAGTVRTRLHRAKKRLQAVLDPQLSSALAGVFQFDGTRCAALTARVMDQLARMKTRGNATGAGDIQPA
jgi:RNA polymerase sigma-70 factor (ECF subfamily)